MAHAHLGGRPPTPARHLLHRAFVGRGPCHARGHMAQPQLPSRHHRDAGIGPWGADRGGAVHDGHHLVAHSGERGNLALHAGAHRQGGADRLLRRSVLRRRQGYWVGPDWPRGAVRCHRRGLGLWSAKGGVEPCVRRHHPARQVDQAGRRHLAGRDLWLDQHPWRALRIRGHPRRQGIPDPERGPDHQPSGQLVPFQRLRAARYLLWHLLWLRSASCPQARDRGSVRRGPSAVVQGPGLPHRGLRRQFRGS